MATGFVYDSRYTSHVLEPGHPESPGRLLAIEKSMKASGLINKVVPLPLFADKQVITEAILAIHNKAHFQSIQKIPVTGEIAFLAAAGVLGATDRVAGGEVVNAFCAVRPPGHHAHNTGKEEGFCFYNNIAIAARFAQKTLGFNKIAILDWDYHHGNGTQDVFYDDPTVLFFSTHNCNDYPGPGNCDTKEYHDRIMRWGSDPCFSGRGAGKGFTINVGLPRGAEDRDIIEAWQEKLLPAVDDFKPDFIFISAGFDSRENDLLGTFAITDNGFARLTRMVMEIADKYCTGRIVSVLEGGYNPEGQAGAVVAHINELIK